MSLIPSAVDISQTSNGGNQLSILNQQTQHVQNLPSTSSSTTGGVGLQQQPVQVTSSEANPPAKFVFNVETDKAAPSLQLLFQLPSVQQLSQQFPQQQQQQVHNQSSSSATILSSQQNQHQQHAACSATQTIAQTQTSLQQLQSTQLLPNLQQPHVMSSAQGQQHCAQHSQVQVATQTPQNTTMACDIISPMQQTQLQQQQLQQLHQLHQQQLQVLQHQQQVSSLPTSVDSSSLVTAQQTTATGTTTTTSSNIKSTGNKKGTEKSRKERNRYALMRQAPAGSQANTTQQYPPAGTPKPPEKTIDVDSETDSNHDTALTLACAGGHEELVDLLISRKANIEHRDKKGFTPLILAATAGHEKVVSNLLSKGAAIEAQSERTKDTPLSLACSGGRYEVVEILLSVGANKEHRNVSDYTPLSLAASGGYVNIIKLLLSHGAEINSRTGSKLGISPLMLAAMNGHTAAVKMLLDMGSDINAQIETNRNTALTLACFQGRHEVVSLLLDRKANVEHRAKTGLTPLMEAASGGYIEVGRVLLDKGS